MNSLKYMMVLFTSLLMMACSTISKQNAPKEELDVYVFADEDINKNLLNDPSPVRINLMQLTTAVEFNQMNELSPDGMYKKHLGESVVDDMGMMLRPKEYLNFRLPLNKNADYLGVVVAYRDLDTNWKLSLYRQDKRWYQNGGEYLYLDVQADGVTHISKSEAMLKLLKLKLEKEGKAIEELTEKQKDKMLAAIEKAMDRKKAANLKKGIYIQTNEMQ